MSESIGGAMAAGRVVVSVYFDTISQVYGATKWVEARINSIWT